MCCAQLAGNAGPKNRHLGTITQLCRAISSQLRHVSTIRKKNLLSSNVSPTSSQYGNMVNFGLLAAEIYWRVWGTPANFNQRVSHLGSVTVRHSSSVHQPNFAALNSGRYLYSAVRPSRWALAHIYSWCESYYRAQLLCISWVHMCPRKERPPPGDVVFKPCPEIHVMLVAAPCGSRGCK